MQNRQQKTYDIDDLPKVIHQVLCWAQQFPHFSYYNPNQIEYPFEPFKHFIAVGCTQKIEFENKDDFQQLKEACEKHKDWLVGYLGYDLKNQLEDLKSENNNTNGFEPIYFYIPTHVIHFEDDRLCVESFEDPDDVFQQFNQTLEINTKHALNININAQVSKDEYLAIVRKIQEHIINGDVYELNYCMEFFAEDLDAKPLDLYQQLISYSPTPFSVFQRIDHQYLICASPERFIKKEGKTLISQPIKGTIRRGSTPKEDKSLQYQLKHSEKERAENMMIVDLVRNDLSKSCKIGSVKVEELFGIYPFKHLHQMISSISGIIREDTHITDAIKNAFPMGSMTGAPKVMAMKLIEQYEVSKRGLFSGAVGYISPDGDFDFNVVIRSIFYDSLDQIVSFQVGSAITYDSIPEQEYEECLLKALAIQQVLRECE